MRAKRAFICEIREIREKKSPGNWPQSIAILDKKKPPDFKNQEAFYIIQKKYYFSVKVAEPTSYPSAYNTTV
jgi:hypothetical protein